MNYNQTPYDVKKTVKQGFIYLLIAFPFVLIVATLLTILKAPLIVVMICNIVVGGGVVLIAWIVHTKIKDKKAKEQKLGNKFDPFKD